MFFLTFYCHLLSTAQTFPCHHQSQKVNFIYQITWWLGKSSATTQGLALFSCPSGSGTPRRHWQQEILREYHLLSSAQFVVEMRLVASIILAWKKKRCHRAAWSWQLQPAVSEKQPMWLKVTCPVSGMWRRDGQVYTKRLKVTKGIEFTGCNC